MRSTISGPENRDVPRALRTTPGPVELVENEHQAASVKVERVSYAGRAHGDGAGNLGQGRPGLDREYWPTSTSSALNKRKRSSAEGRRNSSLRPCASTTVSGAPASATIRSLGDAIRCVNCAGFAGGVSA